MPVEFPSALSVEFRSTDFGQKTDRFLKELYKHQAVFPITIGRAASLLCFLSETIGDKSIRNWEQGGMLYLPNPGKLDIPSVVTAKIVQMRIYGANQQDTYPTYQEVYYTVQAELRQTQLVRSLGSLQPAFGSRRALANVDEDVLFDEEGFWWIDPAGFMSGAGTRKRVRA